MTRQAMRCQAIPALCLLVAGCGNPSDPGQPTIDTATPVAIDVAEAQRPADTYKGLPLELADNGEPTVTATDGIIGVVCIGMSNGNQECTDFQQRAAGEYAAAMAAGIRVVNCAVGGNAIERWIDPAFDADLWQRCIQQRLPAAGVRLDQVRVIWHKAANQFTTQSGGGAKPLYPAAGSDYEAFLQNLSSFADRVQSFFPGVRAVYSSSRSYGGFAGSSSRGEPLSYEEGHALNTWLSSHRTVAGVWYGWGPYLWAPSCDSGGVNGSGICYERADYVEDGVHPATSGRAKVSAMLHARFLKEDWYRR